MKQLLDYMVRLDANNNREWFQAHRGEWEVVKRKIHTLAEGLIAGIASFDPSVAGLRVQDCTYRIARDIRFSNDKRPYKDWIGVYVTPHGKSSGYAGYYLHISPAGDDLIGGHMLWAGLHCPEPVALRSVREEILDNGDEFARNIAAAKEFRLDESNCLKRTPLGFPAGTPHDALLRHREWGISKPLTTDYLLADDLVDRLVADLLPTYPFVRQLNRAVQYAFEEMK